MKLKLAALLAGVLLLAGVHSSGSLPASATSACSGCQITSTTLVVQYTTAGDYFTGFSFWLGPAGPLGSGRAWLSVGGTQYSYDHVVNVSARNTLGGGSSATIYIPAGKTVVVELGPFMGLGNGTYTGVISNADNNGGFIATLEELWQ